MKNMNGQWEGEIQNLTNEHFEHPGEEVRARSLETESAISPDAGSPSAEDMIRRYEESGVMPPVNME